MILSCTKSEKQNQKHDSLLQMSLVRQYLHPADKLKAEHPVNVTEVK